MIPFVTCKCYVILSLAGNPGKEAHWEALKDTVGCGFPIGVGNDKRKVGRVMCSAPVYPVPYMHSTLFVQRILQFLRIVECAA